MKIKTLEGAELPCVVVLDVDAVIHSACDSPRNGEGVKIACCGERIKEHTEPGEPEEGDILCPLCKLIPEGKCACWTDVAGGSAS